VTIDPATGLWQGAPTSGGIYPIVVTAADAQNAVIVASGTFTLTVHSPLSLSTASGTHARVFALVGRPINTAPVTAHGASSTLTWAASGLPRGLALDPATGAVTGRPSKVGDSKLVVAATTATGDTATLAVDFEVVEPYGCSNHLVARKGLRVSDDCGAYWSTTAKTGVGFVRLPGDVSYSARGLPAGLHINADTGVVFGTPRKRGNGSFHFTTRIRPDGVMLTKATRVTSTVRYTVRA
jgi:hypothetical protein